VELVLIQFIKENHIHFPYKINIGNNLYFEIYESSPVDGKVFQLGISVDQDEGGCVVSTYLENIHHCVLDKSEKIRKFKHEYRMWCLYLVDYLSLGLDLEIISKIKNMVKTLGEFDKVVLLNLNGEKIFEINDLHQSF
jgi:hypothetical protein